MAKKKPKAAYVVFRGRRPGVYYNWAECEPQINGFSSQKFKGYDSTSEASRAWEEWNRKVSYKLEEALAPESASRPWMENVHSPAAWIELPSPVFKREPKTHTLQSSPCSDKPSTLFPGLVDMNQALKMENLPSQINTVSCPTIKEEMPNRKRPQNFIDLTGEPEEEPATKRPRYQPNPALSKEELNISHDLPPSPPAIFEEKKIKLSEEQEKVAKLVLKGENVFLTGAAGCGKTVTLKEILRRLKMKKKKVQVVAPTGIAALPLGGRTTYSFAGVSRLRSKDIRTQNF
jgi:ATP-dependent DNA helicase PIF1